MIVIVILKYQIMLISIDNIITSNDCLVILITQKMVIRCKLNVYFMYKVYI